MGQDGRHSPQNLASALSSGAHAPELNVTYLSARWPGASEGALCLCSGVVTSALLTGSPSEAKTQAGQQDTSGMKPDVRTWTTL